MLGIRPISSFFSSGGAGRCESREEAEVVTYREHSSIEICIPKNINGISDNP